jgi:hypothetical protein
MSFLAPWMMVAGVLAAVGVVALHLLSTRRPPAQPLPTARFVPESDVRAVARTSKPTDLLLLALRALAVLLIGFAFAQPVPDAPGPNVRSVVALEWTSALTDAEAARAAALGRIAEGDALVVFDTSARVVAVSELASLPLPTVRRAAFSPMLIAARDAAATIARGADSLHLVVVSAMPAQGVDAATASLRASWPGRIELVPVSAVADTASAPAVQLLPADADDPLAPAVRVLSASRGAHAVRIRRGTATAADSAWLVATPGAVLLSWPRTFVDSLRADGVLITDGTAGTLVAPLARLAVGEGRVLARWRDGAPAVTERAVGNACVRDVGIGLGVAGDLTLRAPFAQVLHALTAACGGERGVAMSDSAQRVFAGTGALASASALADYGEQRSPLTLWLLIVALALLVVEQLLRARSAVKQ